MKGIWKYLTFFMNIPKIFIHHLCEQNTLDTVCYNGYFSAGVLLERQVVLYTVSSTFSSFIS